MRRAGAAAVALVTGVSLALMGPPPVAAQTSNADAVAGFESAGNLLRKCREKSTYARSYCFAYLAAVADSARSYRIWIGSGDPCLPPALSLGRLADSFEAYLIANPSLTSAQAASVIVASLQETFPCQPTPPARAPALPSQQGAGNKVQRAPQQQGQP